MFDKPTMTEIIALKSAMRISDHIMDTVSIEAVEKQKCRHGPAGWHNVTADMSSRHIRNTGWSLSR